MTEKIITKETPIYISNDGTEFFDKKLCVRHEAGLKLKALEKKGIAPYALLPHNMYDELVSDFIDNPDERISSLFKCSITNEEDKEWVQTLYESYMGSEKLTRILRVYPGYETIKSVKDLLKVGHNYFIVLQDSGEMFRHDYDMDILDVEILMSYLEEKIGKIKGLFV